MGLEAAVAAAACRCLPRRPPPRQAFLLTRLKDPLDWPREYAEKLRSSGLVRLELAARTRESVIDEDDR